MSNNPVKYQLNILQLNIYIEFYKVCVDTARGSLGRHFDVR